MALTVEFFGIARRRAGIERVEIEASTFGEALDRLSEELPRWASECVCEGRLATSFLASRNGLQFLSRRDELLAPGDCLLILSADAGG
jgi:molybdopterin converting factor small subunit